ncbi:hypothetical protein [Sorangium cellulosum]|uniref:hypothetical protein n=1 Tax=Sorangium cellulosum TaxID=56 RepID=UPI0018F88738|nr:hypothetical protein [Sorangium cellulosum]
MYFILPDSTPVPNSWGHEDTEAHVVRHGGLIVHAERVLVELAIGAAARDAYAHGEQRGRGEDAAHEHLHVRPSHALVPEDIDPRDDEPPDDDEAREHTQQPRVDHARASEPMVPLPRQAGREDDEEEPVMPQKCAARPEERRRRLAPPEDRPERAHAPPEGPVEGSEDADQIGAVEAGQELQVPLRRRVKLGEDPPHDGPDRRRVVTVVPLHGLPVVLLRGRAEELHVSLESTPARGREMRLALLRRGQDPGHVDEEVVYSKVPDLPVRAAHLGAHVERDRLASDVVRVGDDPDLVLSDNRAFIQVIIGHLGEVLGPQVVVIVLPAVIE